MTRKLKKQPQSHTDNRNKKKNVDDGSDNMQPLKDKVTFYIDASLMENFKKQAIQEHKRYSTLAEEVFRAYLQGRI